MLLPNKITKKSKKLSVEYLRDYLLKHGKGVVYAYGQETSNRYPGPADFCAVELYSACRGKKVSDPVKADIADITELNDNISDADVRTGVMLPLVAALSDWRDWSSARRRGWFTRVKNRFVGISRHNYHTQLPILCGPHEAVTFSATSIKSTVLLQRMLPISGTRT